MTQPSPSLPNPFLDAEPGSRHPSGARLTARPGLLVFVLCLVLGLLHAPNQAFQDGLKAAWLGRPAYLRDFRQRNRTDGRNGVDCH